MLAARIFYSIIFFSQAYFFSQKVGTQHSVWEH